MCSPVLIVERPDHATAVLTLNRPDRRNALSIELMRALCEALDALAGEPQRQVAIVRGAGPAFCAGLDLHEAADAQRAEESGRWVARTFQTLLASPLVTVAAAHGAVCGGGGALMACCDFVVAADDLTICFPETRRGLTPALAAAVLYERLRIGDLAELLLLGEPIDAQKALRMGLVRRVVVGDQVLPEAQRVAAAVLQGGPQSIRQTKRLLRQFDSAAREHRIALAAECHKRARLSHEAHEGLAAFCERGCRIGPRA